MSQFKAFAELEVPKGISKAKVNKQAQTVRYEFKQKQSFMVTGISLTLSLIMLTMAFISLWEDNSEVKWKMFFIFLILAAPTTLVFIIWQNTRLFCLLDFKNMKITTGIAKFGKDRIFLSDDINNIQSVALESERSSMRSSYITFNHRAAFVNNEGVRFNFTKFYSETHYKQAFDYFKIISELLKFDSFHNDFIKNTIIQFLQMFPKYSYLKLSIEVRFEEVIEPLLSEMNTEHINMLLEALNKHSELKNRKNIRKSILKTIDEKFNGKIDKEKYPEVFGKPYSGRDSESHSE